MGSKSPGLILYTGTGVSGELITAEKINSATRDSNIVNDIASGWDAAYAEYEARRDKGEPVTMVEPNVENALWYRKKAARLTREDPAGNNYMENWPRPDQNDTEFIWHLDGDHSELQSAAAAVVEKYGGDEKNQLLRIRIGHIDTGFLDHVTKPLYLDMKSALSLVEKDPVKDGRDRLETGFPGEQDGHGCATLAILAGNHITPKDSYAGFTGFFGAVPFAEVVPVRICDTVYNLFNANDVATAIDYAVSQRCEVITMSMAGYPTKKVAEAVNRAYEAGVVVVTAAGNNWFKGIKRLTPKSVMYPARFDRVIAVTGACYNHLPYDFDANRKGMTRTENGEFMQGNWGPPRAMSSALAAYTPNLPWATIGSEYFRFYKTGGGTSSATPQVAAAAALWILYNREQIKELEGSWKKVEAVRFSLFGSADQSYDGYKQYFGNGVLRARQALSEFNVATDLEKLQPAPPAKVRFLSLMDFFGQWGKKRAAWGKWQEDEGLQEMLGLELVQLFYRDENLFPYLERLDYEGDTIPLLSQEGPERDHLIVMAAQSEYASGFLKETLLQLR